LHLVVVLLLCVGLCTRAGAGEGATTRPSSTTAPSTRPAEEGFAALFNGTDLAGWVYGTRGAANKVDKYGQGYQVDGGGVYCPAQYHGSVYDIVPAKRGFQKPVGEWNEEEIIANGPHITVILNGTTVVDANLDDVKDPKVIEKHPGMKNRTGHLCLIGHHSRV